MKPNLQDVDVSNEEGVMKLVSDPVLWEAWLSQWDWSPNITVFRQRYFEAAEAQSVEAVLQRGDYKQWKSANSREACLID